MSNKYVHNFAQVPQANISRSVFDRNHSYKTTFNSGELIPFYIDEVLPADTFNLKSTLLARLATPIVPFMDNIYLDVFFFFVPNRLVWDNWQRFCGERKNPRDTYQGVIPTVEVGLHSSDGHKALCDYFGIPTNVDVGPVNVLPLRAYNLIWNEWFRDENLQDPVEVNTGDTGDNDTNTFKVLRRGKRHDYFTSCLPFPQKGPAVDIPLGMSAPVIGNGMTLGLTNGTTNYGLMGNNGQYFGGRTDMYGTNVGVATENNSTTKTSLGVTTDPKKSGLVADLSQSEAPTINTLRKAFALQHFYEAQARGGTRYTEILRSHFGVTSPDARLQRPEYLGGTSIPFSVNSVPQTSGTTDVSPQGNLSAFSMCQAGAGFVKSFVEHGYIIGLCSVRADLSYQQGLNKLWSRSLMSDFYWSSFAHIGEQSVLNKEIFVSGNAELDNAVFGYQERYAEYRYHPSMITGKLRSSAAGSLDIWHLSQDFDSTPLLNADFIEEHPPIERVVAVTDEPQFILDTYNELRCVRPMPVFGTPGLERI